MRRQLKYVGGSKQLNVGDTTHDFSQIEIDKIKTNNLNRLIITKEPKCCTN